MAQPMPGGDAPHFRPSLVSWNLTRLCNLRCPHCYIEGGKKADGELTTQECLGLVDDMEALGTEMVILTGGEPLLRKDIYDLATACSERGFWAVMGTNGVLVTDRVAEKMVECGIQGVGISLDSIDPEKHDGFRGGPNSWKHSVRALEICRAHGLEVLVQTTVMEENVEEIPRLLDFAQEMGAWSFNLYFLVQTGRGETMHELTAERSEAMLAELVEVQEDYRPMLVRSKCAPHFKRIAYEKGLGGMESGGCMAGTEYCRITPTGDVTPCPYMGLAAGNVRQQSLREIWHTAPLFRSLRDPEALGGRCGSCEYQELCGGCRCRAYASTGNPLAEDPACTYQPTGVPLEIRDVPWAPEARARIERIPIAFIRSKVEQGVLAYARRNGVLRITEGVVSEAIAGAGRPAAFEKLPFGGKPPAGVAERVFSRS